MILFLLVLKKLVSRKCYNRLLNLFVLLKHFNQVIISITSYEIYNFYYKKYGLINNIKTKFFNLNTNFFSLFFKKPLYMLFLMKI